MRASAWVAMPRAGARPQGGGAMPPDCSPHAPPLTTAVVTRRRACPRPPLRPPADGPPRPTTAHHPETPRACVRPGRRDLSDCTHAGWRRHAPGLLAPSAAPDRHAVTEWRSSPRPSSARPQTDPRGRRPHPYPRPRVHASAQVAVTCAIAHTKGGGAMPPGCSLRAPPLTATRSRGGARALAPPPHPRIPPPPHARPPTRRSQHRAAPAKVPRPCMGWCACACVCAACRHPADTRSGLCQPAAHPSHLHAPTRVQAPGQVAMTLRWLARRVCTYVGGGWFPRARALPPRADAPAGSRLPAVPCTRVRPPCVAPRADTPADTRSGQVPACGAPLPPTCAHPRACF